MATASSYHGILMNQVRELQDELERSRTREYNANLRIGELKTDLVSVSKDRDRLKASLLDREQQDAKLHTQLRRVTHGGCARVFQLATEENELCRLLDEGGGDTQLADALQDMLARDSFERADKRLRFWQTGVEEE